MATEIADFLLFTDKVNTIFVGLREKGWMAEGQIVSERVHEGGHFCFFFSFFFQVSPLILI